MKWPFITRKEHARVLAAELAKQRKIFDEAMKQGALVHAHDLRMEVGRAEAAEAQLHQLAGPICEVTARLTSLHLVERREKKQVIVIMDVNDGMWPLFSGAGRALGYCVRHLVTESMRRLHQHEHHAGVHKLGGEL